MAREAEYDELVMSLVESALSRPASERESFVRAACALDLELCREVLSRVEWEERMGGFLREPLGGAAGRSCSPFEPGELVTGRFRIVRESGRGGMGVVYEAVDETLDRRVALKCSRPGFVRRLPPEVRAAREVSHFNVCKVHDLHKAPTPFGEVEFLSMEYVEGETLASRLRRGRLPAAEARGLARQICAGVAQAHRLGVIHGDIKPANVILAAAPDGSPRAVITDFGLARMYDPGGVHGPDERGGTLRYMAPELLQGGAATVASDIYAFGVLLGEMLTGAPWDEVARRCKDAVPERRYVSVDELEIAISGKRRAAPWIAAGAAVIAMLAGYGYWRGAESPAEPVLLAILPASGSKAEALAGVLPDVARRLQGIQRNFVVAPPDRAKALGVDTVRKAREVLGATHVLAASAEMAGASLVATAAVVGTASGEPIRQWTGVYEPGGAASVSDAMAGAVTASLRLRSSVAAPLLSAAAYPDYMRGVALLPAKYRTEEALAAFLKASEMDPKSPLPLAGAADAVLQKARGPADLDTAASLLVRAKSLGPDCAEVLLASGLLESRRGRHERALEDLIRAAQLAPAHYDVWRRVAREYSALDRVEDAAATFRKAIAAHPGYHGNHVDFANFWLQRGNYEAAAESARRVVELAPANPDGHQLLGLAFKRLGRFAEAGAALEAALRLRRDSFTLINLGSVLYVRERYQEAAVLFEESARGAGSFVAWLDLGYAQAASGRRTEARAAFEKALAAAEAGVAADPRGGESRAALAWAAAMLGDRRRAVFEMDQALAIAPGSAVVRTHAIFAFEALGLRERSLAIARVSPPAALADLARQPDLKDLARDPEFRRLLAVPGV